MTRDEARLAGLKRYDPPEPCSHGHSVQRYVKNNDCVECAKIRAGKYAQQHREAAVKRAATWRQANPERHRQNARNAYARNPEVYRERAKQWALDNPDQVKENAKRTYTANPERSKRQARKWAHDNPGKTRAILRRNRCSRNKAKIPLSKDHKTWMVQIYADCPEDMEVDHIYPVNNPVCCGLHVPWNLQYLDPITNRRKSNKLPENGRGYAFETLFRKAA
jgi:hypothetical protein